MIDLEGKDGGVGVLGRFSSKAWSKLRIQRAYFFLWSFSTLANTLGSLCALMSMNLCIYMVISLNYHIYYHSNYYSLYFILI